MACVLHCLLLPITFVSLPFFHLLKSEIIHIIMLALILPVALISFYRQKKKHRNRYPLLAGSAGVLLLLAGLVVEVIGRGAYTSAVIILNIAGSALLICGHYLNIVLYKKENP